MAQETLLPVLVIEDDDADAKLLIRKFQRAGVLNPLVHLRNGDLALSYLSGLGQYSDRTAFPLPVLIILDLRLPGITGLELLRFVRKTRNLKPIPVVVLSGEEDQNVVRGAYDLGANSFLVKSANEAEVLRMAVAIRDYWLVLNRAPSLVLAENA